MNEIRFKLLATIFTSIFIAGFPTFPRVIAESARIPHKNNQVINLVNRDSKAKNIAIHRYQFVKYLQRKIGLPFYTSSETSCMILFPLGKSDRLYTLLWNAYWPSGTAEAQNVILCYKRKNGKVNLDYRIQLKTQNVVSNTSDVRSLLDYLHVIGYSIPQKISYYENQDLKMLQDYVVYRYWVEENTLEVFRLSDFKNGRNPSLSVEDRYKLDNDPLAKHKLRPGDFYRKYGLPLAKSEL